ncbi:BIRC2_3 [Mytilus edulis]|uniref:BIRC2_3 n=1 Tax=Mytilus edulis TaxID=6550 RepID=A0A8S3S7S1_MYTED|nr:BIRC2_3 [Mytilus edulis]
MALSTLNTFNATTKLASYANWKGPHFPIIMAGKGFSYSGQDFIVECDCCKAKVDMKTEDIISLSDSHAVSCRISQHLRTKKANPIVGQGIPFSQQMHCEQFTYELLLYPSLASIMLAPSDECPCKDQRYVWLSKDLRKNLINSIKQRLEEHNGPIHPQLTDVEERQKTFALSEMDENIETLAEAGFYYAVQRKEIVCFYCDGSLRKEVLATNPWKEHGRWFPVCPHVIKTKGESFVHDIMINTKALKTHLKGLNRPKNMQLPIVLDAINEGYPRCIIRQTIQGFFCEYGSFPTREEFFSCIESIKQWKTFVNVPCV